MFGWFSRKASKEDIQKYIKMLTTVAIEDKYEDKAQLTNMYNFIKEKHITDEQLAEVQSMACNNIWSDIMQDGIVTEDEAQKFSKYLLVCEHLTPKEVKYWNGKIELNRTLYDITVNDKLPIYDKNDVQIIYKDGEILHYSAYADMMKMKTVTKKINYSGPSASIRICKGVRYHVGSMSVSRKTSSFWTSDSWGIFWISNMRIGFLGSSKAFAFPISKLFSISDGDGGLHIFKEGRATPYIIRLSEYEEPCAIISNLLNKQ